MPKRWAAGERATELGGRRGAGEGEWPGVASRSQMEIVESAPPERRLEGGGR
jgi:hypothetical protein